MNSVDIPLSGGTAFAIIDADDYEALSHCKWGLGTCGYARRTVRVEGRKQVELMHRVILSAQVGQEVDHINRNPLDNRRANLRLATRAENNANRPTTKNKRGGVKYKGVYKNSKGMTFSVRFKNKHIANFSSPEDAAKCYDKLAVAEFGEFAKLNFPHH